MPSEPNQPTFSILSVVKNVRSRETWFRRSIESVLHQTFGDFELVIQDGASTDGTAEIIAEYDDPRIQFLSRADSCGEEGFYRALRRCRGTYIGSCLSDEQLLPDALETARAAFRENLGVAAIYGNYWTLEEDGRREGPFISRHPFSLAAYVCQLIVPPFCNSFFSGEHVARAGIHDHPWRYHMGEFEFWIRVAGVGPVVYVPYAFNHFGKHAQSHTSTASIYDSLTGARVRAMPDLFKENQALRESGVTVDQAIAGNYAWAAHSVFCIEGASDRYRRFVEAACTHDPQNPRLPDLVQRLAERRSPREAVPRGEERGGVETAPGQPRPDAATASDEASDTPYLSLVVTTRNDDHGGNMLQRFQSFLDHLGRMCARHKLPAELIVVEWNPDPDRPRLLDAMRWPEATTLNVRIVTVPPDIHARHGNADKFPLFQMIAKNVGIRRARGEFVLATNIDLLFSDELCAFLARRELDPECFYRIDRHDLGVASVPEELDWQERLGFCEGRVVRVHAQHGTYACGQPAPEGEPRALHTNACGDFTLMARRRWLALRGYPEFHLWSIYLDGVLVHAALAAGLRQIILREPCRLYHIEHDLGWAKTTEPVKTRPSLDYTRHYLPLCQGILEGKPLKINPDNWGLADVDLEEVRPGAGAPRDRGATTSPDAGSASPFARWIDTLAAQDNRLYFRDQSARSLASLAALARQHDPTVIVELGTLGGLSLRTWLAASTRAKVVAIDLSFATLAETRRVLPLDLSRVTLVERDILQTDLASLWTDRDRVILFVDAHDLPGVPIMEHVLTRALPSLPDGSLVVVDDLWFSEERLTHENARRFFESRVLGEIDELQCFTGHYAPCHEGGSFMGFAEVLPLLDFVNRHGIPLIHDRGGKHVVFFWKREYLSRQGGSADDDFVGPAGLCGSVAYNPLESVPTAPALVEAMRRIAGLYRQRGIREAAENLSEALTQPPHDEGLVYGLAVCLARGGKLSQARDLLARRLNGSNHPRYRRLHDDLVHHLDSSGKRPLEGSNGLSGPPPGETVYTLSLTPEQRTCTRLARLVDPSHQALFAQGKAGVPGYLSQPLVSEVRDIHLVRHRNCVLQVKGDGPSGGGRSFEPSDYAELLPDGPHEIEFTQPLLPWFSPWGFSWQHFVQDTLPVLAGCRDYLQAHPEVEILLHEPTHDCLQTLLQVLGIGNRVRTIPFGQAMRIRCRELLMPRVLPRPTMWGWPPELYRRIPGGWPESLPQDRLIYVSRSGCTTRRIKNESQVIERLRATAKQQGLEMLVFDAHELAPVERLAAFRRARIVVGPHGGANYHVLFCRPGTSFVELCFYRDMHTLYNIASAMDLDYWMLPVDGGRRTVEAEVDIGLLDNALRSILGNDGQSAKDGKMPSSIDHMELSIVLDSFPSFSVIERLRASQEKYNVYSSGSAYQKERLAAVAACCVRDHPGDLIEIGCYVGATTRHLCQVARRYGRRVIAVDPWETGTQNCTGGEYETFLKNVEEFRDVVDIIRSSSLAPEAIRQIQGRELAFAFVDGLHNYEACRSDIRAVSHCHGVIAVDDTSWCPGVRQAFVEAGKDLHRSAVFVPALRESYLLAGPRRTSESDAGHRTMAGAPAGLTLFAMPKAFAGHVATIQSNAIRSWTKLVPAPEIILFGNEPGIKEMAEEAGARHIPEVSRNEFGTPLVDKLFEAAEEHASHSVLAYVNADMIFLPDFTQAVQKVQSELESFLLIGQRWDLAVLDEIDFDEPRWREWLRRQLQEDAVLHAECGLDYFVFRKGLWPRIPPFAIGRTAWDNWLVMDPHKRGVPVVDGTDSITAVHQDHDYGHVAGGRHEAWNGSEAARNQTLAGPTDPSGLTSGATWVLRADGTLAQTPPRRPQYITGEYRDRRSAWLLRGARRLSAAGANELAACKCEETLGCLDVWLEIKRIHGASPESVDDADIAARYLTAHTLLAQCYMRMGRHDEVVATYTRLLEHPALRLPDAQRESIGQVRDRLVRQLEGRLSSAGPSPSCEIRPSEPAGDRSRREDPSSQAAAGTTAGRRPKVTVVTACRNGEEYLRESVDSVLNQTMPDWELLLVDDGSTDNTRRLIEDFARRDTRIRVYHFPDNRGPYARRNFAIRQAASDFIVIHDAGDIMSPVKLETLHREISRDDCLAVVGSFYRSFLEEFKGIEHTEACDLPLDHESIAAACSRWRAGISHGTAVIRKALFERIGLYDENPFAADLFWSAKLALYAQIGAPVKMANVPDYLTFIRVHPDSQTQLLPVFDPRDRWVRYRNYCECTLTRIREKWRRWPQLDVAAELRNCNCSDFLTRFRTRSTQGENEALPSRFTNDFLGSRPRASEAAVLER